MKKLIEWLLRLISEKKEQGIAAIVAFPLAFLVGVIVLRVGILQALFLGFAATLCILLYEAPTPTPPAFQIVAVEAGNFLLRAFNQLQGKLPVFHNVLCDSMSVEDGTTQKYPRWSWERGNVNGMTLINIGLVYLGQTYLSTETLQECCVVLQRLLAEDVISGLVAIPVFPTYMDGTPALHLLEIKHIGRYLVFSFVYVSDEATARKIHEYGAPPTGTDSDDEDF